MSSILEALKKLEEEKQRQLKLLEKEEEEKKELSEPISISTIAKADTPLPLQETSSRFLSPKFLIIGLILLIVSLCVISISASLWVVKTQIAKNTITTAPVEITTPLQKPAETPTIQTQSKEEVPPQNIPGEVKETPSESPPPTNPVENTKQETEASQSTSIRPADNPNNKIIEKRKTSTTEEKTVGPNNTEPQTITTEPPPPVAKNTSIESTSPTLEEVNKKTTSTPISEIMEETPQKPPTTTPSENNLSPLETTTTTNEKPKTETQNKTFSPPQSPAKTPIVITKDLEPPPSLKPEQFQQTLSLQKPKIEEPVDMTRLPVLRTSDRARLGLADMKLNVLREASPNNPHGLAIINLTKIYVGEMIPGTSVRLLDVKTHGIAIEVVGTGERYYVPR